MTTDEPLRSSRYHHRSTMPTRRSLAQWRYLQQGPRTSLPYSPAADRLWPTGTAVAAAVSASSTPPRHYGPILPLPLQTFGSPGHKRTLRRRLLSQRVIEIWRRFGQQQLPCPLRTVPVIISQTRPLTTKSLTSTRTRTSLFHSPSPHPTPLH